MKKASEVLIKRKLLVGLTLLATLSGTMIVSVPNVAADMTSSIYVMVKSILAAVQSVQTTVQSIQTTVENTNNNLNNVKIETVITGPPINLTGNVHKPQFNLTANQPWDLMAVYISTEGFVTVNDGNSVYQDTLQFGIYRIGSRQYFAGTTVAEGHDVTDFPIFPGEITNKTQSVIAVPPNVQVSFGFSGYNFLGSDNFIVSFKIVIQRPIDPSFSYNVTWG